MKKAKIASPFVCAILVLMLLSSCARNPVVHSSTPSDITSNPTTAVSVGDGSSVDSSVEEPSQTETTSNVTSSTQASGYYMYSEVYETNPSSWSKDATGRATVRNLPEYSFDEDTYYNKVMNSNGYTRTNNFVRGVTGDFRHITEGYNLSAATQQKDAAVIPTLNLSGWRYWTEPTQAELQSNLLSGLLNAYTSSAFRTLFPLSKSPLGEDDGYNFTKVDSLIPQFNDTAARLSQLTATNGMSAYLMANEFHNFTNHGFDQDTQQYFKQTWLPARFGSLENMNRLLGTTYPSFDKVFYNNGTDHDALYGGKSDNGLSYEFWLCRRYLYEESVYKAYNIWHAANPKLPIGMATYGQNGDTYGPLSRLDFLNVGASNLYPDERRMQATWAFDIDRNLTTYEGKPFYITEMGYSNKNADSWTDDTLAPVARGMKQTLALAYMRPQVQGAYWFNFGYMKDSTRGANAAWGVVDPWHNRTIVTDTMGEVYSDFEKLDNWMTGASSSPVVAISDGMLNQRRYNIYDTDMTAKVLYAKGVTVKVVRSLDNTDLAGLTSNKLIWTDENFSQTPTGKEDSASAMVSYLKNPENSVLYMREKFPTAVYGIGGLGADTVEGLKKLYPNFEYTPVSSQGNYTDVWKAVAPFIHGDFVSGKVAVTKGTVDSSTVRILDSVSDGVGFSDLTFDVQQQLLYKNGHVYLCLVNSNSDAAVGELNVVFGVNAGAKFNLHPQILAADGNVSVSRSNRALVPEWVDQSSSKIAYGMVTIKNLDTYAFIDLGMAVVE